MFPVDAIERTGKSKETGRGEGTRLFLADNLSELGQTR